MDNLAISYLISFLLLVIALIAIGYKWYRLEILRRKHHVHIRNSVFTLYPSEYIVSTTSEKKREFMIISNRATYISLACLGVVTLFIFVVMMKKLILFLESIN